jgi:hypothetical protein
MPRSAPRRPPTAAGLLLGRVDQAELAVVLAAEEVVEADLIERGRVPPDVGPDPPLDVLVAGEPRLAFRRDRVDEVGASHRPRDSLMALTPYPRDSRSWTHSPPRRRRSRRGGLPRCGLSSLRSPA